MDQRLYDVNPTQFELSLLSLLDEYGAIATTSQTKQFCKLMEESRNVDVRALLLTVLQNTRIGILRAAVQHSLVTVIHSWVSEFVASKLLDILKLTLNLCFRLPMTVALIKGTKIGKTVARLGKRGGQTKHPDQGKGISFNILCLHMV